MSAAYADGMPMTQAVAKAMIAKLARIKDFPVLAADATPTGLSELGLAGALYGLIELLGVSLRLQRVVRRFGLLARFEETVGIVEGLRDTLRDLIVLIV
jgi:hypothetical protein